jgi:ribosome modulation factor
MDRKQVGMPAMSEVDADRKNALPWKRNGELSGYRALDITLKIGDPVGSFTVTRIARGEPNEGNFVAKHNDVRISDRDHAQRADAQAECERYMYDLPIFRESRERVRIVMTMNMGRDAYHTGQSVFSCPFKPDREQERSQWVEGWLQAYIAPHVAKVINSASATIRAMNQLEGDLAMSQGVLKVWQTAVKFALMEAKGETFVNLYADAERYAAAINFLELFTADKSEELQKGWPEWLPFFERETGATIKRDMPDDGMLETILPGPLVPPDPDTLQ